MITEVEWGRYLGKGSYGSVYLGFKIGAKQKRPFAIKVFDLKRDTTVDQCISLLKEFRVMEQIPRHERVVECFECGFDERGKVCMLLEYMAGGTLGDFLRTSKEKLSDTKASSCIKQVAEGVAHLHDQGVFHRDLKGDNILIVRTPSSGEAPHLKLADFGSSKLKEGQTGSTLQSQNRTTGAHTAIGTALWMAPEVITSAQMSASYHPAKADIWSVGIVSCEILQKGQVPWGTFENPFQALFAIGQWKGGSDKKSLPPGSPTKKDVSAACFDFLKKCLDPKPKKRLKASELLSHTYLSDVDVPIVDAVTVIELDKRERQVDAKTRLVPCSNPRTLQKLCQEYGIADGATKLQNAEPSFLQTTDYSTMSGTMIAPPESITDDDIEFEECDEEEPEFSEDDDEAVLHTLGALEEEEDTHTKQTDDDDQSTHIDEGDSTDDSSELSEDEEEEEVEENSDEEYESHDISFCTNLEPAPMLAYGPPPPPEIRSQPFTPLSSQQQHKTGAQWVPAPVSPAGSQDVVQTSQFGAGRGARRPAVSPTLPSDIDSSSSSLTSPGILKPIGVINLSPSGNTLKLNYNKHMDPTPPPGTVNRLVSRYEYYNTSEYYPNKGSV